MFTYLVCCLFYACWCDWEMAGVQIGRGASLLGVAAGFPLYCLANIADLHTQVLLRLPSNFLQLVLFGKR